MLGIKSFLLEIGIAVGVVVIFFLWIAGIRRQGKEQGRTEQWVDHMKARQETLKIARDAKKRFGMNVQDLEHDDNFQYKAVVHGKTDKQLVNEGFEPVYDERGRKLRYQYANSPFGRI
jgi:hypothetical protein